MKYKAISWNRKVKKSGSCERLPCVYSNNWTTDLICRGCGRAIKKVNPLHLVHIFIFLLLSALLLPTGFAIGPFTMIWLISIWIMFCIGYYVVLILRREEKEIRVFSWFLIVASPLQFFILTNRYLKETFGATPVILSIFVFALCVLIIGYIRSFTRFAKLNDISGLRAILICISLAGFNMLILSFLFHLPLGLIAELKTGIKAVALILLPNGIESYSQLFFALLDISFKVRAAIIIIYAIAFIFINAIVETFKEPVQLQGVFKHIEHIIRLLAHHIAISLKPLWELYWGITRALLSFAVFPWLLYGSICGIIYLLVQLACSLTATTMIIPAAAVELVSLGILLSMVIPLLIIVLCEYGKKEEIYGVFRNLMLSNVNLIMVVLSFIFLVSLFLWAMALVVSLGIPETALVRSIRHYEHIFNNHSAVVPAVMFPIAYVTTRYWRRIFARLKAWIPSIFSEII
jgi:hypothetical protein